MAGGTARVYAFPALDSVLWSVSRAPGVERVLGFDPDDGSVALIDKAGLPRRIDLRATEVRIASRSKLASLTSANGSDIFGVTQTGDISRLNPTGDWAFVPPSPARWVFPQPNGAVVIAGNQGSETHLWLIRPTDDDIIASTILPLVTRGIRTRIGDRIYFTVDSGLIGVLTRDLSPVRSVRLASAPIAAVPTPSGDRLYVARTGSTELTIVDRYSGAVSRTIRLPGEATDLRMDPLGQHVLARSDGDSAWVIAIGSNEVKGSIRTAWRNDLPAFAPDGAIATVRGDDVVLVSPAGLRESHTVAGGAGDFWFFFAWNGFRPRPADLDLPVTFDSPATGLPDTLRLGGDSLPQPTVRDASPSMTEPPPSIAPAAPGFMVSFAAVLSEQRAREVASGFSVNGVRPRVAASRSGSTTIYRVVLGPYQTRDEAERVGRESRRQYWVYEESR
ncbi:MAG: SPOR domain-containing protein [Gemmatimonadaceae bacterium]